MEQVQVINNVIYNERNPIHKKTKYRKINISSIVAVIAVAVVVFNNNEVKKVFLKTFFDFQQLKV